MVFGLLYDAFQLLLGVSSLLKSLDPSRAVQTGLLVLDVDECEFVHRSSFGSIPALLR